MASLRSSVRFVVTSKLKTPRGCSECLVNGLEAFIKQHYLRASPRGFSLDSAITRSHYPALVNAGLADTDKRCPI